jgi:hypothetical protein
MVVHRAPYIGGGAAASLPLEADRLGRCCRHLQVAGAPERTRAVSSRARGERNNAVEREPLMMSPIFLTGRRASFASAVPEQEKFMTPAGSAACKECPGNIVHPAMQSAPCTERAGNGSVSRSGGDHNGPHRCNTSSGIRCSKPNPTPRNVSLRHVWQAGAGDLAALDIHSFSAHLY